VAYTDIENGDDNEVLRDRVNEAYGRIDAINTAVKRTTAKKTCATPVTQNLFTVSGGAVKILSIVVHITTAIEAGANNTTGGGNT
jgi:hypothetical protein